MRETSFRMTDFMSGDTYLKHRERILAHEQFDDAETGLLVLLRFMEEPMTEDEESWCEPCRSGKHGALHCEGFDQDNCSCACEPNTGNTSPFLGYLEGRPVAS